MTMGKNVGFNKRASYISRDKTGKRDEKRTSDFQFTYRSSFN